MASVLGEPAMPAIGIENISVFGMPPVEFVALAADLGCQHISTGLSGFVFGVHDYPMFSLRDDAPLRREMIAAMRDTGVSISLGEGCTIRAGGSARDFAHDLDLFAELGAPRINSVSMDPDFARTCDELAVLAEMCATRGLRITTELAPSLTICDLPTALAALKQIGRPDFRLLIDTMHLARSGSTPDDIAALDPKLIDYVQICDAPRVPAIPSYFEESMFERMVPGAGELDLRAWLRVLPPDRVYALEVPQRSAALAGQSAHARLGACVAGLRRLLAEIEEEEPA
jgi:sugar phosphate isomerase/epimerase